MQRIGWIDMCRGIFMLMILWFHTEVYYTGNSVIPYSMYVEDALAGFFFISGYLSIPVSHDTNIISKSHKIWRHLIVPYLFFTILFALPKTLIHGNEICMSDIIADIATGKASWFVYSLVICNIYILFIHNVGKSVEYIHTICYILPFIIVTACNIDNSSILRVSALGLLFMYIGHIYRISEPFINNINNIWIIPLATVFAGLKYYIYTHNIYMTFYIANIDSYLLFFFDTILFCLLSVKIWQIQQPTEISGVAKSCLCYISWIGRHCIMFYFLCGGVPLITSRLMPQYTATDYHLMVLAFLCVCAMSSAATYVFYKTKCGRIILGV